MSRQLNNARASAAGFSMIELLVAVLITGIGVLGVAALQLVSLQNNRAALARTEAVNFAYDMMDRIRANPQGRGSYDGVALGTPPPSTNSCAVALDCSAGAMAQFDITMWKCQLGAHVDASVCVAWRNAGVLPDTEVGIGLPEGDGSIALLGEVVRITVRWTDGQQTRTVVVDSQT